ncbi:MAG: hypothetical protein NTU73_00585, partial [Ignavibacteriae bacterium]|nr:hypothetical protein [Ignavibacteriota bacterium]
REMAILKMKRALRDYKVVGVKTNINFLLSLLECKAFVNGDYNTQYVEKYFLPELKEKKIVIDKDIEIASSLASILFKESHQEKTVTKSVSSQTGSTNNWLKKKLEVNR